ncbi:MAG: cupin domain-containing protein [Deltaproteobacteria bacterium]|nr:cupin domain-containing protein [Deltaproteobacteria bacterium]
MAKPKTRKSLQVFDEELRQFHMQGQWGVEELLVRSIGGPRPKGKPFLWKWETVYSKLLEACEVLPESFTARRSLLFANPGLPGHGSTHTLLMGIQMIKPGEVAWAHRHTMAAIRFVIQGDGKAYTAVDGEICPMENNDLILTPQWTWHDHHNPTDKGTLWLDALDVPLIIGLNVPFYEPYPGNQVQVLREKPGDYLQRRTAAARPTWEAAKKESFPLCYRWKDIEPQLRALAERPGSPYDGVSLEYVNPMTGGPTLPTLSCWIQLLKPGERTRRHRHTSSAMYFVVRGQGATTVEETSLEWGERDSFVIPNWAWHEHKNRSKIEEAILFSINDIPVMNAFGLYREEPENSLHTTNAPQVPAPSQVNG